MKDIKNSNYNILIGISAIILVFFIIAIVIQAAEIDSLEKRVEELEYLPDLVEHVEITTYVLCDSVFGSSAKFEY